MEWQTAKVRWLYGHKLGCRSLRLKAHNCHTERRGSHEAGGGMLAEEMKMKMKQV